MSPLAVLTLALLNCDYYEGMVSCPRTGEKKLRIAHQIAKLSHFGDWTLGSSLSIGHDLYEMGSKRYNHLLELPDLEIE